MTDKPLESTRRALSDQRRLLDSLERKLADDLTPEFKRATKEMMKNLDETDSPREIDVKNHQGKLQAILIPGITAAGMAGMERFIQRMIAKKWVTKEAGDRYRDVISERLAKYAARKSVTDSGFIARTTAKNLISKIKGAKPAKMLLDKLQTKGLEAELFNLLLGELAEENTFRALFVGTLTSQNAMNQAPLWLMKLYAEEENEILKKIWLTQRDGRVRDDHVRADNQRVPVDADFIVAGDPLAYPGDGSRTTLENVAGCRCFVGYVNEVR